MDLPQRFGRDDGFRGGGFRGGRGGGGLRGMDRDDRRRDDRRRDSPPRRRRSRSRSRSRSPRRDREPRRTSRGGVDEEADPKNWEHTLARPADDAPGEAVRLAGCHLKLPKPERTLWEALEELDVPRVEALLDGGEDVNQLGGPYGCTPLGWAAFAGKVDLAKLLLAKSADPNVAAAKGSHPLHMAVWNGDAPEIVQLLIDGGAQLDATNRDGKTALDLARWFHNLERQSRAEEVYRLREWRERYAKPRAGRAASIAALAAAAGVDTTDDDAPLPDAPETFVPPVPDEPPPKEEEEAAPAAEAEEASPAAAKEEEAPAMEEEAAPAAAEYRSMAAEASPEAAPSEAADEMDPLEAMVGANM